MPIDSIGKIQKSLAFSRAKTLAKQAVENALHKTNNAAIAKNVARSGLGLR